MSPRLPALTLSVLMGCLATALADTPFIDPIFEFTVKKDVVFATAEVGSPEGPKEMELKLDLYRPVRSDLLPKTLPAMIFMFGGGFKRGSKSIGYIRDLCEHYAKRGYVTVAIDYRLIHHDPPAIANPLPSPPGLEALGRTVNAAVQDTANSIRWLRDNAADLAVDPNRIGVGGVSAGALNALFAGHAEADVLGPNAHVATVVCFMAPPGMQPSLIDADDPPTFFGNGDQDKLAALTGPYVDQLDRLGVDHKVCLARGLGHRIVPVLDTVIDGKTVRDHSVDFCFQVLRLSDLVDEAAPPGTTP